VYLVWFEGADRPSLEDVGDMDESDVLTCEANIFDQGTTLSDKAERVGDHNSSKGILRYAESFRA
jgi:hypothetical protein